VTAANSPSLFVTARHCDEVEAARTGNGRRERERERERDLALAAALVGPSPSCAAQLHDDGA
jgi:hypothetical protein